MAARANLNVDPALVEYFIRVQETKATRILKIKIQGETIMLDRSIERIGTAQQDFETLLVDSLVSNEAAIYLFCLTDTTSGVLQWLLVAWIPEDCKVRDKMLYSSSKDDLKRSLGIGYFDSEYSANEKGDMDWSQYQKSLNKSFDADLLSAAEKLNIEERV